MCDRSWLHCFASYNLSNVELTLLAISTLCAQCFGEGSFYYGFRIYSLCLIKNLMHLRVSLVWKRVRAIEGKLTMLLSRTEAHLYFTRPPLFYNSLKRKNDKDYPHSKNAPTFFLGSSRGGMPLVLSFPRPHTTQPTLIPAFRSSQCEGSMRGLNLPCRRSFVSPCLSMLSFLFGTSIG
jgi:hypothetical protein